MGTDRSNGMVCVLALLAFAACDDRVIEVSGSGSSGSGANSASSGDASSSSGGDTSRTITVSVTAAPDHLATGVVFQSHQDGSLVTSWAAADLPVTATVVDGDLVTYVLRPEGSTYSAILHSLRVTPATTKTHYDWSAAFPILKPGPDSWVFVSGARTGLSASTGTPADVELDVSVCANEKLTLLAVVEDPSGTVVGRQYWGDLEPNPGGGLELTATLDDAPVKPLPFQISVAGEGEIYGSTHWSGSRELAPSMYDPPGASLFLTGPASLLYSPNVLDLPGGFQVGSISVVEPSPPGACHAVSEIVRFGGSDSTIPFDASGITLPEVDGVSWKLGPGSIADELVIDFATANDDLYWNVIEDPHFPPLPTILPTLPSSVAPPSSPPALRDIAHQFPGEAHALDPDVQWTLVRRVVTYDCD